MEQPLNIVILGLSITSSWGNGHATIFRALTRGLARRGHHVLFLERDMPWYADNRDLPNPPHGRTALYDDVDELRERFERPIREADLVMVGSYVPDGVEVGRWVTEAATGVTAFYDIDTPVTIAKLDRGDHEYLTPDLIRRYELYLSFTGGPILSRIEGEYGSPRAVSFYCCVDRDLYYPEPMPPHWDMGYMGTHSDDRQPPLERLMLDAARRWPSGRFVVAGPQYPDNIDWPGNVHRIEHLPPAEHRLFYNRQSFTLNITRSDMIRAGYSPSVRLFEAAACGTPIISDWWDGLDTFFEPNREVLISHGPEDTLRHLRDISEPRRREIAHQARLRVLHEHTADRRVAQLESHVLRVLDRSAGPAAAVGPADERFAR